MKKHLVLLPYLILAALVVLVPAFSVAKLSLTTYKAVPPAGWELQLGYYTLAFFISGLAVLRIGHASRTVRGPESIDRMMLFLLVLMVVSLFLIYTLPNFLAKVNRGIARTQLGFWGLLVTFIMGYLLPLLPLQSYARLEMRKTLGRKLTLAASILFVALFGVLSGYKAAAVLALLPLGIYFTRGGFSFRILLLAVVLVGATGLITIVLTTKLDTAKAATDFLFNRILVQTGYGLSAAITIFPQGGNLDYVGFELFGFHLAQALGFAPSSHMATALSIAFYGPTAEVLSRQANVTPSPFGEGIYLFGLEWAWLHAIILAGIVFALFKKAFRPLRWGSKSHQFWLIAFSVNGLLLLNGSSIFSIISLPTVAYLVGLRIFLFSSAILKIKPSVASYSISSEIA